MATKRAGRLKPKLLGRVASWAKRHKVWTIIIILAAVSAMLWAGAIYYQYLQKFSKADYDQLTTMAETVLKNSGGKDIQVSRTCSYERPSEFADLHLYCRVAMVTYMPYVSDEQAVAVADSLQKEIKVQFGRLDFPLSRFYTAPRNGSDTATLNLAAPFPKTQCNFYIQSNRNAKQVLLFPAKDGDNLIALSFECAAESRAEYFPVTYRQG